MPNISVFYITNNMCSPILVLFSYTGLVIASICMIFVRDSINAALLSRNKGT